ncbi:MAG TPA: ATP-binding protein [Microthrixaceae bacterium]|nr:ATP-binding protein [Microthrixaceae bacterium]
MMARGLATFVNRTRELEVLDAWCLRSGPGLGIVYGRRRVGKSWLLAKFADGRRVVQHTARGAVLAEELRLLSQAAAPVLNLKRRSLAERPFTGWDDVIETFAEAAETEPVVLILDEFPELMRVSPNLEEELRALWGRVTDSYETHLKLLVCGSAVSVMESLQEERAAMFGRADLRLAVQPFRPHEAALMLPNASPADRAAAWGVCGGIPRYLALWDDSVSFQMNLDRLVTSEQGLLLSEGELVLADEDIVGHGGRRLPEQVLRAVAGGATTFQTIQNHTGKLPTRVLVDLTRARLLDKVYPVGEDPERSKRTSYRIADNFLAFWLTCIEPHRGPIERGLGPTVKTAIVAAFDDFMGPRYEDAFRSHLRRLAAEGLLGDVVDVGEWWRVQGEPDDDPCQLDAVVLKGRGRRPCAVGEAKWARKVNGSSLLGSMRRKLFDSKLADPDDVTFYVCARTTVDRSDGMQVVTASDIFG